jgi:WD40 repeat protein
MTIVAAPPLSPFKGLSAFDDSELDALLFFGRERERDVIVANVLASRLTVLYGESGVGKSSVLRAGVVRELRRLAPTALVEVHDSWSTKDATAVLARARDAPEAYLILDQFEEFFLYHHAANGAASFVRKLADLLRETSRVHVLVSLREDSLALLDAFRQAIPAILANRLQLQQLDREAARAAIVCPVRRWSELAGEDVHVEDALVEAVLNEVAVSPSADRIEAPYLQLVMQRIWDEELARGSAGLRLETLRELGGAKAIVRDHLERALRALGPDELRIADSVFEHLVTPSGTKIAHRVGDLAQYAAAPEEGVSRTLATLARERIVRTVDGGEGGARRYEIFHDVLAQPVRAWRSRREFEVERAAAARRQRRLVALAGAAVLALLVVAGVAIFAFLERGSARSAARHAHARELEATSLQQLSVDPEQSLMLALDAARLEPGAQSENVLRQALIAARLRLVLSALGPIRAVAYSPDGRRIATAGTDGRVRLFDAATGRLQHVLREWGRLASVSFSPDGTRVLVAADNGVAIEWDASTGRRLERLHHKAAVTSASFSRDGRWLLTSSHDGTARIFGTETGRTRLILRGPGPVELARFSPDGLLVATVVEDAQGHRTARLSSTKTGALLHALHGRGIDEVVFSPDGRLVATASQDGATRLFDTRSGRLVRTLDDGGGGVVAEGFSPDGKLLATGSEDGALRIWDVATGARDYFFIGHTNGLTAVAWSPDGRLVADASADRTARIWAVQGLVEAGGLVAQLAGHREAVTSLAFSPDGRRLVTGGGDWSARVWDARPEQVLQELGRHEGGAVLARYAEGWRLVLSAGRDGRAKLWNVRTRRVVRTFGTGSAPLVDAELSPGGRLLVTAGEDGVVRLWDVRSGMLLHEFRTGGALRLARFSPDGRFVLGAGPAGAQVWDPSTGRLVTTISPGHPISDAAWSPDSRRVVTGTAHGFAGWSVPVGRRLTAATIGPVSRVAFAPDGGRLAVAAGDGEVRLYDAAGRRLEHVLKGHKLPVTALVLSRDGRTVLTSSQDFDARSWDAATGKPLELFRGHFGPVSDVAISEDGRWVATAGPISAGLWAAATGRLVFYLRGHTGQLRSVDFSPDGKQILTASLDGTVRTYTCEICGNLPQLVTLARERLERTSSALTATQRARYLGG